MASTGEVHSEGTDAQAAVSSLSNTPAHSDDRTQPGSVSSHNTPPTSSKPVEMSNLALPVAGSQEPAASSSGATAEANNEKENTVPGAESSTQPTSSSPVTSSSPSEHLPSHPVLSREQTAPAIGPTADSSDKPPPMPTHAASTGPQLIITLLLHTGARHPYRIDERYLKKRNVNVADNNPVNMSVYTLKELIWRDWREGQFPKRQGEMRGIAYLDIQSGNLGPRALIRYD
ncbi:hypothetical protein MMC30_007011 [Trapelia coarctata]|nr:hypothetical protein [Trapelia coarctata]